MIEQASPAVKKNKNRWWLPILILGAAGAVAAALVATKPKPKPVSVTERAWRVSTVAVQRSAHQPSITLYGRVESLWSSQLTAGVTADVVEVAVIEGDQVEANSLLVRLDDRDAQLQLAQREAELKQAEAQIAAEIRRHAANVESLPRERQLLALTRSEVNRLRDLVAKQVGAQSQLDEARQAAERQAIAVAAREQAVDEHEARLAEVEAARARVEALRDQALLELERCIVLAPFNGRIAQVLISPGTRVRTGDALIDMYDTDALMFRAQIPSRHLPAVRAAITAERVPRVSGEIDGVPVEARLRSLAGEAASGTGGVDGLFQVVVGQESISQGRFVRLTLLLPEESDLIALPHEAIYGTDRIYTVDEQSRMRSIQVERVGELRKANGKTQVLIRATSLADDTPVIATQLPNALDGLLVSVAEAVPGE